MTSLLEEIVKRIDHVSFHTPGHSGGVRVFPGSDEKDADCSGKVRKPGAAAAEPVEEKRGAERFAHGNAESVAARTTAGTNFGNGTIPGGAEAETRGKAGFGAGKAERAEPPTIAADAEPPTIAADAEPPTIAADAEPKTIAADAGEAREIASESAACRGSARGAAGDAFGAFRSGNDGRRSDPRCGAAAGEARADFGRKRNAGGLSGIDLRYDVTELPYTDNLLESNGAIRELERRWAAAYRADDCLLFTNGATGAVFSALAAAAGKLAVVGGAHVSVYRAASLFKKPTVFLKDFGALSRYLADAERGAAEPPGAIFVTNPTYLGQAEPLLPYRALADRAGAALLVDSAHGSHFAFYDKFPVPATEYGDLVIYSLHKTLSVMAGGAALAVKAAFSDAAREARRATHTTSPSYPVLLSAEGALDRLKTASRDYAETFALLELFEKDLAGTAFRVLPASDRTRVTLVSPFDGSAVYAALAERGVYAEYAFDNRLVLIVTPYNQRYLSYLALCLKELRALPLFSEAAPPPPVPERKELKLDFEKTERVPLSRAEKRTLAAPVGLYPPGVPNLFPGDALDRDAVAFLVKNRSRLFGLAESGVLVVK